MRKTLLRQRLEAHVANLSQCRRCPRMFPPPVSGGAVVSPIMIIGQAPGVKEPVLAKPFAWTAGRTLFAWFNQMCGLTEDQVRSPFISPQFADVFQVKRQAAPIASQIPRKFGTVPRG